MGEGGQYPSHPRPEPPTTSKKKKACLDFDQGKNIAGQGKFLKPKRSGLGPVKRGSGVLGRGPAQAGFHPQSALPSASSRRQKDTWRCVARP